MSAKKTIKLSNIKPGEYISWFVTTQAANMITVRLYDSEITYFSNFKESTNIEPPLAQGSAHYTGTDLAVDIEVTGRWSGNDISTFLDTFTLLTPQKVEIGHSFTCCGEDSTDNDYNDVYINVMGWSKQG
jgi:hypothetical protein